MKPIYLNALNVLQYKRQKTLKHIEYLKSRRESVITELMFKTILEHKIKRVSKRLLSQSEAKD